MELQTKQGIARLEVKDGNTNDGSLHIRAYACAFNNIDSAGDIIVPSACDKYLAGEESKRTALCYQHDVHTIIGKITDKGVDETGMWIEADVLPTSVGKDVITLMKAGAISEFSIGYCADKYHYDADGIRILEEISIYEVSPVTIAANPKAVLVSSKADTQGEVKEQEEAKGVDYEALTDEELDDIAKAVEQEQYRRVLTNL